MKMMWEYLIPVLAEDRFREAHQAAHEQRQLKRLARSEDGALSGLRGLIRRVGLLISARRAASGEGMPNHT